MPRQTKKSIFLSSLLSMHTGSKIYSLTSNMILDGQAAITIKNLISGDISGGEYPCANINLPIDIVSNAAVYYEVKCKEPAGLFNVYITTLVIEIKDMQDNVSQYLQNIYFYAD